MNSKTASELKVDSLKAYNELNEREVITIEEYNTNNPEIENIKRPGKPVFKNLEIDTIQAFGIWVQDPSGPHADFWLTSDSFYVADYDGDGEMPYILDKNKITIFYNDFLQNGIITLTSKDTLKIKWIDEGGDGEEIKYTRFKN